MHDLMKFASLYNAAIIVTNQVMSKPDAFFGDPTKPIGGHIVGHTATFQAVPAKIQRREEDSKACGLSESS